MSVKSKILIAGESWTVHSIHQKGFDSFTTTEYAEGVKWLREALDNGGYDIEYQPAHVAATDFPCELNDLNQYDCVVLSDIGTNTLLLHPETFNSSHALPNRLQLIADYVRNGGGLVMIGGYLTFQGIDAKARYHGTPVEDVLPVMIDPLDDRSEQPQGVKPVVVDNKHPIVSGLETEWPILLGYNRVKPKMGSSTIVKVDEDPLIVAMSIDKGRSVAFTSDCGPHWAPPDFVEWAGYARLWQQLIGWAAGANNG
jgi:uncharacterized membrane protein